MIYKYNIQSQIFTVYNLYRLVLALVLILLNTSSLGWVADDNHSNIFISYSTYLYGYCLIAVGILVASQRAMIQAHSLAIASFFIDILFLNLFLYKLGGISSGAGILINVSSAAFSLMLPGILALFFAALSSLTLLVISTLHYLSTGINHFFLAGVHSVGIFATAFAVMTLASWARKSEVLAQSRKTTIDALQNINAYIVERLHSGILLLDDVGVILMSNQTGKDLLKISETSHLQMRDINPALMDFIQQQKQQKAQQLSYSYRIEHHTVQLQLYIHPIINESQRNWLIFAEDLSLAAQQAQQLKLASLGRFSASIAHEVRNPLQAIDHAAHLLGESTHLQNSVDSRLLEIISRNSERMNTLVKNVLQLSRREKSIQSVISLNEALMHIVKECQREYPMLKIHYELDSLNPEVLFDRGQLTQVLHILIDNACKHAFNDSAEMEVKFIIHTSEACCSTRLLLQDNGSGVPNRLKESLFEPINTTSSSGTGLGLYIARELCEANGAKLQLLESSLGATFAIDFAFRGTL